MISIPMSRSRYTVLAEKYQMIKDATAVRYEWEMENMKYGDKEYDVFCNFDYRREAVDYQFDPRLGKGRDLYAEVPYKVLDFKAYVSDPQGNGPEVTDQGLLKDLGKEALHYAREQAIDKADFELGQMM